MKNNYYLNKNFEIGGAVDPTEEILTDDYETKNFYNNIIRIFIDEQMPKTEKLKKALMVLKDRKESDYYKMFQSVRFEILCLAYAFLYYKEIYNNNIKEIYKPQLNRAIEIAKNNNFEEIIDYIMFEDRGFYTLNKQVEIYHNE